jgi:hypothetical protein
VSETDKLLMYVMENCRSDQVESMLEISQTKGRPLAVMVVEAIRVMMDSLPAGRTAGSYRAMPLPTPRDLPATPPLAAIASPQADSKAIGKVRPES